MEKLFGIPTGDLMVALLVISGVAALLTVGGRASQPACRQDGAAQLLRRRSQTALIVLGLMLATILFSAAFATGDTMTHSFRLLAVERLGEVDVVIAGEQRDASGRQIYFDQSLSDRVRDHLSTDTNVVEGVAPLIRENVTDRVAWDSSERARGSRPRVRRGADECVRPAGGRQGQSAIAERPRSRASLHQRQGSRGVGRWPGKTPSSSSSASTPRPSPSRPSTSEARPPRATCRWRCHCRGCRLSWARNARSIASSSRTSATPWRGRST